MALVEWEKQPSQKAVYNKFFYCFERSYFLENVREKSRIFDGIIQIQDMHLCETLGNRQLKDHWDREHTSQ